jgi:acyl carrier protein
MSKNIRDLVITMLADHGHRSDIGEHDSLFFSGKLDSLAATQVMMTLEQDFGIDLTDADFDISQLDTIARIEALVAGR